MRHLLLRKEAATSEIISALRRRKVNFLEKFGFYVASIALCF
jgi:hypothetical protein